MPQPQIRVTVWNEFRHEKADEAVRKVYPAGLHAPIIAHLCQQPGITARAATLDEPEHGLTQEVLDATEVLIWWGHMAHHEVKDEIVNRIQKRILDGMGLIVLHSGHLCKIMCRMMGTSCLLTWREAPKEKERLWIVNPTHPITAGIGPYIELPAEEMYGEFFDVPTPDDELFISWFQGGEVFRSGLTWNRGKGKIFYFRPGHETFPTYYHPEILRVITNAVRWAKFAGNDRLLGNGLNVTTPLEPLG